MDAMMQSKTKSEKLAHILGYQFWAVTNLPPLQESRPEIPRVGRGKRENMEHLLNIRKMGRQLKLIGEISSLG